MRPPLLPCSKNVGHALVEARTRCSTARVPAAETVSLPFFARSFVQAKGKIEDSFAAHESFFMVVLDVDIEDMNGSVQLAALIVKVLEHSVEAALFTCDEDIGDSRLSALKALVLGMFQARLARNPILEALRVALDVEIATQHIQQTVVGVQSSVLGRELVMNGAIGGTIKVVDVGFVKRRARKAH